jgi:RND family efflux transporter MFP subunit
VVPGEEIATMRAQVARKRDAVAVAEAASREAGSALAEARAQEAEAAAALATATARLALATKLVADTVVRSPLEGVVRRRHVTLGQYVRAGDPIAELVDRSRLRLRFRVNEAESTRLSTGLALTFLVPALSPTRHQGRLVHVDEAASPVSRMVECLGEVEQPDPSLKPGFFVVASVETRSAPGLAIPEEALLPSEQGWIVFVVEGKKAVRRAVAIGLRTQDGNAEVLDGLKAGETLVVRGANVLSEGAEVAATPFPVTPPPVPGSPADAPATPR